MRAVVQRVTRASVTVDGEVVGAIERGLCVFVGAGRDDDHQDVLYMAGKIVGLRIFADDAGKMNLAVGDVGGAVLLVSQFTLFGDVRSGRRPGFAGALEPQRAEQLYQKLIEEIQALGVEISCGRFRASMRVSLDNDGPVTILIDSKKTF